MCALATAWVRGYVLYNAYIRHNAYRDRYSPVIFRIRIAMCADELSPRFPSASFEASRIIIIFDYYRAHVIWLISSPSFTFDICRCRCESEIANDAFFVVYLSTLSNYSPIYLRLSAIVRTYRCVYHREKPSLFSSVRARVCIPLRRQNPHSEARFYDRS